MKHHFFRAFREPAFVLLWVGEVFTQIASNLFNFYLILVIFTLTHSNTAVAGVIISFTLPAILFGVLAGVYVDQRDKKRVLYVTNVLRALLLLLLALFHDNVLVIYLISLLFAFITQFFIPAESPIIPLLVPEKVLYSANALFSLAIYGSLLLAYVLSGPLLLAFGSRGTLIILAGCLFLGAFFISLIKIEKPQNITAIESLEDLHFMREIKQAFSLVAKTREIYSSLSLLALAQILLLIVAAIAPGYASQVLHMKVEEFPLVFVTPAAIGMILGGAGLVNFFHDFPKNKMVVAGLLLSGLAMYVLPFASALAARDFVQTVNHFVPRFLTITNIHILIVLAFLLGVANALVFVPSNTILQEKTSDNFRGKIYGVLNSIVGIFSLVPVIAVGGLSDVFGVGHVIMGIGICLLLLGGYRFLVYR